MTQIPIKITRLFAGLLLLSFLASSYGQTVTESAPQSAEPAPEPGSVYETLVFDRPEAVLSGEGSINVAAERFETIPTAAIDVSTNQNFNLLRFQDAVELIEFEGGAWDINLTENLASMAEIYQKQGRHQEAIDSFTRAMHVSRVNLGLNSLEHLPMVEQMIDSFLALGDWASADQYHEYLYYSQRREYGMNDPRMVPVLHRLANWKLSVFNARWGDEVGLNLLSALRLYRIASNLVSTHFGQDDERYVRYLRDAAGTAYLVSRYRSLIEESSQPQYRSLQETYPDRTRGNSLVFEEGYQEGLEALQRITESFPEEQHDSVEYAQALILEADWYLLFERRRAAQAKYHDAYQILLARPDGKSLIEANFGVVKPLPVFSEQVELIFVRSNFEGRAPVARDIGYVDVQFDVTAYGSVANLEVLTDDSEVDSRVISSLRRQIRGTVFRPVIRDGEVVRSDGNRFRYRYVY